MIDKNNPSEVFAALVVQFNTFVDMVGSFFEAENYIRQADWTEIKSVADTMNVFIDSESTLDDIREGCLSEMKSRILNAALTFKKQITFSGEK
jgi:hypothetical protein